MMSIAKLRNHTKQLVQRARVSRVRTRTYSSEPRVTPCIVVGLSGGPDSVFLLHLLTQLRNEGFLQLIAAHLNHGWRAAAERDVAFCQELCQKLSVPLVIGHAADYVKDHEGNGSKEALGRLARRRFFEKVAHEQEALAIALGHHADDQMETFFIRLLRGASLTGLVGMQEVHGLYVRPLLRTSKQEIIEYLNQHAIAYCVDETNESCDFLRNRIRHQVIPALEACDTRFERSFAQTIARLQETESFMESHAQQAYRGIFGIHASDDTGDLTAFMALPAVLQKRVLISLLCAHGVLFTPSTGHLEEMMRFLTTPRGGKHEMGENWLLWKKEGRFGITKTARI